MKSKSAVSNSSSPAHVLLSPTDNNKVLDFINFNTVGTNNVNGSTAFKKIQSSSKSSSQTLFSVDSDYSLKYNKLNNLYLADYNSQDSLFYGIKRQHEYATSMACLNNSPSLLDNKSTQRMLSYNFDVSTSTNSYTNESIREFEVGNPDNLTNSLINTNLNNPSSMSNTVSGEFGSKNGGSTSELTSPNNLVNSVPASLSTVSTPLNQFNNGLSYSEFFIKSPNQQILSSDRNVRNIDYVSPNKTNYNFKDISSLVNQLSTRFTLSHIPTTENNSASTSVAYDRFSSSNMNSPIMSAKEELAPNFIFTPFWVSI